MDVDSGASASAAGKTKWFTDLNMQTYRDNMEIKPVTKDGLIDDWEAAEAILEHTFNQRLLTNPSEHPMMMAEPGFNTSEKREKLCTLMFEKFDVPAFFLSKDAVLSAFASGRATALVLDLGGSCSRVSPVHDGYILKKGVIKNKLAGDALTEYMGRTIQSRGSVVKPHYTMNDKKQDITAMLAGVTQSYASWMAGDVVRDVKESFCRTSELRYDPDMFAQKTPQIYELPDGQKIQVGPERYLLPELMLQPELGDEAIRTASMSQELKASTGLINMIGESINRCDPDIRRDLFQNVVLTGGSSLFPGLNERLHNELALKVSAQKVKVVSPHLGIERRFSAWIGGSILASLGTFHQLWMSKKEFEEHGPSLVEKRCP